MTKIRDMKRVRVLGPWRGGGRWSWWDWRNRWLLWDGRKG